MPLDYRAAHLPSINREIAMNYLLNRLSMDEKGSLEAAFFSDDNQFEELEIAEDELIDHYVRNELSDRDRKGFEAAMLSSRRLSERVKFARALAAKSAVYNSTEAGRAA